MTLRHSCILEPLLPVPFIFPTREPGTLLQSPHIPVPLNHPVLFLFLSPLLQSWQRYMLHMPCILVLHDALFPLLKHLCDEGGYVWLISELFDWGE